VPRIEQKELKINLFIQAMIDKRYDIEYCNFCYDVFDFYSLSFLINVLLLLIL